MHYTETNRYGSPPVTSYIRVGDGATVSQINEGPISSEQPERQQPTTKPMTRLELAERKNQVAKLHLNWLVALYIKLDRDFNSLRDSMDVVKKAIFELNKIL